MRFKCVTEHKEHKLNYPVVIKCSAIYDKERKERSGGLYINTFLRIVFLKSATLFRTPTAFSLQMNHCLESLNTYSWRKFKFDTSSEVQSVLATEKENGGPILYKSRSVSYFLIDYK